MQAARCSGQYILDGEIVDFCGYRRFVHGVRIGPDYGLDLT